MAVAPAQARWRAYDTPEAAARRKRAHDAWRSRNAWNHGDPPGIGPM